MNQDMLVEFRDITGDGIRDALVLNYIGGSGGCGGYRLYAGPHLRPLWRLRDECEDTTRVRLGRHGVDSWIALDNSHTSSVHCCYHRWTHREWRWKGGRLRLVRRIVTTHPPPVGSLG